MIIWSSMIFFWPPLSQRRIKAFVSRPQIPLLISGSPSVSKWEPDLGGGGWCGGSVGFVATVRPGALLPACMVICPGLGAFAQHRVTGFKGGGLSLVPQWEGRVSPCPQRSSILTAGHWNIGHLMLFDLFSSLWSRILFSAKLVISCVSIFMPQKYTTPMMEGIQKVWAWLIDLPWFLLLLESVSVLTLPRSFPLKYSIVSCHPLAGDPSHSHVTGHGSH